MPRPACTGMTWPTALSLHHLTGGVVQLDSSLSGDGLFLSFLNQRANILRRLSYHVDWYTMALETECIHIHRMIAYVVLGYQKHKLPNMTAVKDDRCNIIVVLLIHRWTCSWVRECQMLEMVNNSILLWRVQLCCTCMCGKLDTRTADVAAIRLEQIKRRVGLSRLAVTQP